MKTPLTQEETKFRMDLARYLASTTSYSLRRTLYEISRAVEKFCHQYPSRELRNEVMDDIVANFLNQLEKALDETVRKVILHTCYRPENKKEDLNV